jgi:hypothetical protein
MQVKDVSCQDSYKQLVTCKTTGNSRGKILIYSDENNNIKSVSYKFDLYGDDDFRRNNSILLYLMTNLFGNPMCINSPSEKSNGYNIYYQNKTSYIKFVVEKLNNYNLLTLIRYAK